MSIKQTGMVIAMTAAALFANASVAADNTTSNATNGPVHCFGINSCKGQSLCNTATNGCKGQNSCKGKGWIIVANAKICTDKGGTIVK